MSRGSPQPWALLALLALPVLAAPTQAPSRTLRVAAAANLKTAAEALKVGFEAEQPGVQVVLTLGASGTFVAQLENGAPYDLFLSADREYPSKLIERGLAAAADERVYAIGTLVLWLPPGSRVDAEQRGLAALADPAVRRIALANPAVAPFGRAAQAALRAAGVEAAVKDKLVLGTSVAQAAQFATTGAVDAALLPASLVEARELSGGRGIPVPQALYPRLEQSGVVLSSAREPALARALLAFITGPKGRAILLKHGYALP
jgi:molybdate transport system substrate-binding protein